MKQTTSLIGHTTIVIESTDTTVDPDLATGIADHYGIAPTSGGKLLDAYGQIKEILQDVSDDLGKALATKRGSGLSAVSVEFALSFAGEANVWVLKAGGQGAVKATLTWSLTEGT